MVMVIECSSTRSIEMAGSRATLRGIVGSVETVRIGENGIVVGSTNALIASIAHVRNADLFRPRMIQQGKGRRCGEPSSILCPSRPCCRLSWRYPAF